MVMEGDQLEEEEEVPLLGGQVVEGGEKLDVVLLATEVGGEGEGGVGIQEAPQRIEALHKLVA